VYFNLRLSSALDCPALRGASRCSSGCNRVAHLGNRQHAPVSRVDELAQATTWSERLQRRLHFSAAPRYWREAGRS